LPVGTRQLLQVGRAIGVDWQASASGLFDLRGYRVNRRLTTNTFERYFPQSGFGTTTGPVLVESFWFSASRLSISSNSLFTLSWSRSWIAQSHKRANRLLSVRILNPCPLIGTYS